MFDMYLVPIYKYKRPSKLHLITIKILLSFESEYLEKFCNF